MTNSECGRPSLLDEAPELQLSTETLFDVLSDWRRRRVLWHLDASDDPVALADLAELLADDPNSSVGPVRTRVSLHHSILPRLSATGLVIYGRDSSLASLTEAGAQIQPYVAYSRTIDANLPD